jgi:hypothetical protein
LVVVARKEMREVKGRGQGKSIPGREPAMWRREEIFESEDGHLRDERWRSWASRVAKPEAKPKSFEQIQVILAVYLEMPSQRAIFSFHWAQGTLSSPSSASPLESWLL